MLPDFNWKGTTECFKAGQSHILKAARGEAMDFILLN